MRREEGEFWPKEDSWHVFCFSVSLCDDSFAAFSDAHARALSTASSDSCQVPGEGTERMS